MKSSAITVIITITLVLAGIWFMFGRGNQEADTQPTASPAAAAPTTPSTAPASTPAVESSTSQQLNTEQSSIIWEASRIVGSSHTGTVPFLFGSLTEIDGTITEGEFIADMTGITENKNSTQFLTHIRSDDFFAVDQYPTANFVLTSVNGDTWTGDMTIRGITQEISFPVVTTSDTTGTTIEADLELDRTRWGITFDSSSVIQNLGDKAIKDNFTLTLKLVFDS